MRRPSGVVDDAVTVASRVPIRWPSPLFFAGVLEALLRRLSRRGPSQGGFDHHPRYPKINSMPFEGCV